MAQDENIHQIPATGQYEPELIGDGCGKHGAKQYSGNNLDTWLQDTLCKNYCYRTVPLPEINVNISQKNFIDCDDKQLWHASVP